MKKTSKIIQWIISVFLLTGVFVYFPSIASLLFLIAAVLVAPIPFIREKLASIKIRGVLPFVLAGVLFFGGVLAAPKKAAASADQSIVPSVSESEADLTDRSIPETEEAPPIKSEAPTEATTETPTETPTEEPTETATEESTEAPIEEATEEQTEATTATQEKTYIINTNTGKFHKPTCSSVKDIKESNKMEYTGTREDVIAMGYTPCGKCNP